MLDEGRLLIEDASPDGGGRFVVEACGGESIALPGGEFVFGGGAALWFDGGDRVGFWPVVADGEVEWAQGQRGMAYLPGVGMAVWDEGNEEVRLRSGPGEGAAMVTTPVRLDDTSFALAPSAAPAIQSGGTVLGVLDLDRTVHVVDGAAAGQGLVVADALEFALSPLGRTVLVRSGASGEQGLLRAYDRVGGGATEIGNLPAAPQSFRGPYGVFAEGVYDPDTATLVPYPAGVSDPLYYGGTVLIDGIAGVRWDIASGEVTSLDELAPQPRVFGRGPGFVDLPYSPRGSADERMEGVTVVPFDGSAPLTVDEATRVFTLSTGHTLFHDGDLGESVPLFEPLYAIQDDGEPGLLEEAAGAFWVLPEGDLVVEVQDGERSGLYRFGLP